MQEIKQHFTCPYCGQTISVLLDLSAKAQQYIEDCEVCCHPIEISFNVEENTIISWAAVRTDG